MDNDRAPDQAAPAWSTQANASSSDGDNDSAKFTSRSTEGDDVEMDEAHDSGAGLHATPTMKLVPRLVATEEDESMDVSSTVIDRASPKEVEMQGLGPVEDIDSEVFEVVQRPVTNHPSSALTKDVVVCKFCNAEFPYVLRDMDHHKKTCEVYKQQTGAGADVTAVEDADLPSLSLDGDVDDDESAEGDEEAGGRREVSSSSPPSESVELTDEEEASAKEVGGGDGESADDDEETQMLDEPESHATCHDRSLDVTAPLPRYAVEKKRPDDAEEEGSASVVASGGDDHKPDTVGQQDEARGASDAGDQGVEGVDMDTGGLDDAAGADVGEEEVAEEGSVGNGSAVSDVNGDEGAQASTPNSHFRKIDGSDRVECVLCEKTFANRGSSMTAHRKKCRLPKQTPKDQSTMRDDKQASHLLLTPQKKPAVKRRITNELDKLEGGVIATDQENPFNLRTRKRSKADGSDAEASTVAASTAVTPSAEASTTSTPLTTTSEPSAPAQRLTAKRDDDPMVHFVAVGPSSQAKQMMCLHCKGEFTLRFEQAKKHLGSCDAYKAAVGEASVTPTKRRAEASTGEQANHKRPKTAATLFGKAAATGGGAQIQRRFEELTVENVLALDAETQRAWIFGSPQKAEDMRKNYRDKPLVVRGPAARFRALRDALCELNVEKMLEVSPMRTTFTELRESKTCAHQSFAQVLTSREHALFSYENGRPIAFRPPETVVQMLVPRLAKDLGCGSFVPTDAHDVKLVCTQARFKLDWQLHESDTVVVCLQGKLLWKMQRSPLKNPPTCVHTPFGPMPQLAQQLKPLVSAAKVGTNPMAFAPPVGSTFDFTGDQGDDDEDMDEEGRSTTQPPTTTSQQVVVDAGSVVYMPPGTWFHAEVLEDGHPCVLLQIQLKARSIRDMFMEAMRQVMTTEEWHESELNALGCENASQDQTIDQLFRDTITKLQALQSTEVVPKLLRQSGGVTPTEIVVSEDGKSLTKIFEFDLTDRNGFQGGKDIQLLQGSTFRVNPLVAMFMKDELAQYGAGTPSATSFALVAAASATSKKALTRKQKRPANASTQANSSESSNHQGVFVLVWGSADTTQMLVKFRCSQPQSQLIEWIRSRDTADEIYMNELKLILKGAQDGTADVELLKQTLRFLCTVGYLTNVEVPLRGD